MRATGKIIVLAYPDTFVTMSDEWICKLLPLVGLGTRDYIKAGHAALVLIENETGKADYYDFGRYITPKGFGRVRSAVTDSELELPFPALLGHNGKLKNLNNFLIWLDKNPQKTHGEGRLLASVCEAIDFEKAQTHILALQKRGSIPYGAFQKEGSNCSRFVTDTILAATSEKKIIKALQFNKKFTPSTVGNVEKAASKRKVFEVLGGVIQPFDGSAFKENLKNYFDKKNPDASMGEIYAELGERPTQLPVNAQMLAGTGSSAWFEVADTSMPANHFRIRRYNDKLEMDYDGVFFSEEFDPDEEYCFVYDSHCAYCHVLQKEKKIQLHRISNYSAFSSSQRVHSA